MDYGPYCFNQLVGTYKFLLCNFQWFMTLVGTIPILGPEEAPGAVACRTGSPFWVKTKSNKEWKEGF